MMKVAVLFDYFGPYHLARLRGASKVCDLLAVQFGSSSGEYEWDFSLAPDLHFGVVNPTGSSSVLSIRQFRARLNKILSDFEPRVVVVPGWATRGSLLALAWAESRSIPVVIMSESTAWDEPRISWKEKIKRRIVGLASSALVGGIPHGEYIQQLGMPAAQVVQGYDVVDNDYFSSEALRYQDEVSPAEARKFFLSSNRFIEKKNLFRLLEAFARHLGKRLVDSGERDGSKFGSGDELWDLCLLGDGELKGRLLAHAATLGLNVVESAPWEESAQTIHTRPATVFFPGFRQIDELPRFYAHAGAFIHASTTEQWGLVVNEAMASGLPVIVSNRVGCARDLVQDGLNGFTFDPYSVEALASLLCQVSASDFSLEDFGNASRSQIIAWGPDRFAEGLKAVTEIAVQIGTKRIGSVDRLLLKLLTWR